MQQRHYYGQLSLNNISDSGTIGSVETLQRTTTITVIELAGNNFVEYEKIHLQMLEGEDQFKYLSPDSGSGDDVGYFQRHLPTGGSRRPHRMT